MSFHLYIFGLPDPEGVHICPLRKAIPHPAVLLGSHLWQKQRRAPGFTWAPSARIAESTGLSKVVVAHPKGGHGSGIDVVPERTAWIFELARSKPRQITKELQILFSCLHLPIVPMSGEGPA